MNQPYQLIVDLWEANADVDAPVLQANGVTGMIVRLNSISGALHMDEQFYPNWAKAKTFEAQALYFVYTPWATGRQNYDWLMAHIPADYGKRRVFVDVEVRRAGYAPATYAAEVAEFTRLVEAHNAASKYSGGGFLDILNPWPKDEEYWWAAYSTALTACHTWDQYRGVLANVNYDSFTRLCPGEARMWQATGDGCVLPGFGDHAVDVNVFPGTVEELRAWFGCEKVEEPMTDWTKNAIGFYTKTADGAAWGNNAFNFVVAYAGGNWTKRGTDLVLEPNEQLKPIELKARAGGKVLFALWDFDVDWYTRNQKDATDTKWPTVADDYPLQAMIAALQNRDFDGLIIRMMNRKDLDGGDELMSYVAFAAGKFVERANEWLYKTKGLNKWTFVLTNDEFMRIDGKQEDFYRWTKNWWLAIKQEAARPLANGAWPNEFDKIKAVPLSLGWKFWYHYDASTLDMLIWNGTDAEMRGFLEVGTTTPPDPGDPPTPPPACDDKPVTRAEFDKFVTWAKNLGYKG